MSKDKANWDALYDFMDKNDFDVEDFLAVICSNLSHQQGNEFKTMLAVAGYKFDINIKKEIFDAMSLQQR